MVWVHVDVDERLLPRAPLFGRAEAGQTDVNEVVLRHHRFPKVAGDTADVNTHHLLAEPRLQVVKRLVDVAGVPFLDGVEPTVFVQHLLELGAFDVRLEALLTGTAVKKTWWVFS